MSYKGIPVQLRYYTDELGWRARTSIKVMKWKGAWPDIHVKFLQAGCKPGSIMRSDRKLP